MKYPEIHSSMVQKAQIALAEQCFAMGAFWWWFLR
jgi:hypothetical protein